MRIYIYTPARQGRHESYWAYSGLYARKSLSKEELNRLKAGTDWFSGPACKLRGIHCLAIARIYKLGIIETYIIPSKV